MIRAHATAAAARRAALPMPQIRTCEAPYGTRINEERAPRRGPRNPKTPHQGVSPHRKRNDTILRDIARVRNERRAPHRMRTNRTHLDRKRIGPTERPRALLASFGSSSLPSCSSSPYPWFVSSHATLRTSRAMMPDHPLRAPASWRRSPRELSRNRARPQRRSATEARRARA